MISVITLKAKVKTAFVEFQKKVAMQVSPILEHSLFSFIYKLFEVTLL